MINICMLMFREIPKDNRRLIVANAVFKKNGQLDVICIGIAAKFEIINGVNYYRIPLTYTGAESKFILLYKYLRYIISSFVILLKKNSRQKYDIIHVHNPPDFLILPALFFKQFYKSKIILDLHDMFPEVIQSNFNLKKDHFLVKIGEVIERFSIIFSDLIFVTNPYDKMIVMNRNRINADKIKVLLNSSEKSDFGKSILTKRDLGINDEFVLIYQGTIWQRRGLDLLVNAVKKITAHPIKLIIAGGGPYSTELKQLIWKNELNNKVILTGWVSLAILTDLINFADLGIIPFKDTEVNRRGVPNKLFEYIEHKKPVLASRLPGMRMLFDDDDIIFFKPDDENDLKTKIIWAINNKPALTRYVQTSYNKYHVNYNWNSVVRILNSSYDELSKH